MMTYDEFFKKCISRNILAYGCTDALANGDGAQYQRGRLFAAGRSVIVEGLRYIGCPLRITHQANVCFSRPRDELTEF